MLLFENRVGIARGGRVHHEEIRCAWRQSQMPSGFPVSGIHMCRNRI